MRNTPCLLFLLPDVRKQGLYRDKYKLTRTKYAKKVHHVKWVINYSVRNATNDELFYFVNSASLKYFMRKAIS